MRPTTVQFCCPLVPTLPWTDSQLCVWGPLEVIRTTECPEPLCLAWALPAARVTSRVTSEGVTPPSSLLRAHAPDHRPLPASVVPWSGSLGRLSRVPAGPWSFPTLSLPSVWRCLDPYPAVFVRCLLPISSPTTAASRHGKHVRHTGESLQDDCDRERYFGAASHSLMFRLPHSLDLQIVPTAVRRLERPGRVHHASPRRLPAPGCGIATCLHGHLTRLDLHQLDGSLVGCSFPHCAFLLVSCEGLWDLSRWERFRLWLTYPIVVKQSQGVGPE